MSRRALALAAGLLAAAGDAQAPSGPRLRIASPDEGSPVSGVVVLRAEVEPADAAALVRRVSFSADGRPACVAEQPPFECEWDAGPRLVEHVVRAVASLHAGGRLVAVATTPGASGLVLETHVSAVQVTVTVTDARGRFVRGLTLDDFRVREDGVPQPVTALVGPGAPRELLVAVDVSASMAPDMDALKRAVGGFLDTLREDDRATLLAFNNNIFTLVRREQDAAARRRAVARLAPWGGTALYDVMVRALDLLARRHGRKALVVFTDGEDQSSHAGVADVERRADVGDTPAYLIGQGRGTRDPVLKRLLQRLADVSGGQAFTTDGVHQLEGVFARIGEELDHQYLLAYEPTNEARDGTWRRIDVELLRPGLRARARQGYRALGADSGGEP